MSADDDLTANEAPFALIAAAILDGEPIDWSAADASTDDEDRPLLDHLKHIAALAEVHRAGMPDAWGHLRILERVGRGAFGDVYRAWDSRLDREVALKLLPAEEHADGLATSIIEEGRLLARIRHPNVVTIYGAERIQGRIGLWMELVAGRTLHDLTMSGRRFTSREVVDIGRQICSAVSAVHGAGLLHRDIKAQNVMIADDGRVVLMDFGAGRETGRARHAGLAGTPLYLAPEVITGTGKTSVAAEIYSIGVLLFFLLTGKFPVRGSNLSELRKAHAQGARANLRTIRADVHRGLAAVIERAIDPDPARRFGSADTLAAALTRVVSGGFAKRALLVTVAASVVLGAIFAWNAGGRPREATPSARIAVLPFTNGTDDPGNEHLADGITEGIIRALGMVRGLDVRSRTSSFTFKGGPRDLGEIQRRLGVDYVVEGTVVRADGLLVVDAKLLEIGGKRAVWSKRLERGLTVPDIQAIQDDVAAAVVDELQLTFERSERRYALNLETYDTYLRARTLAERRGYSTIQAVQLFEKVIESDPTYTPAYAGLVIAYAYMSMSPYQTISFEEAHAIMRPAAIKAVDLDSQLAEAHAARGWVHAREFEWAEADASFRRAIALNPSLTFIATGYSFSTLRPLGRPAEAEALIREAARLDPLSLDVQRELAQSLLQQGKAAEAIAILERIRQTDSDLAFVDLTLGRALVLVGRIEESLPLLERRRERLTETDQGVHPWIAWAYVKSGRREDAEQLARANDHLPFRRAIINAALGNADRMFDGLEEMASREPQRLAQLMRTPEMSAYRSDERFRQLLRRLNMQD